MRSDGPWREQIVDSGCVDIVLDPVGGDRFVDSLRCLREGGRLVVVGFAGGSIPEVKVNRLLLRNIDVVGAGWPEYAMSKPAVNRQIATRAVRGSRFFVRRIRKVGRVQSRWPNRMTSRDSWRLVDTPTPNRHGFPINAISPSASVPRQLR